jgi:hypothetical protein
MNQQRAAVDAAVEKAVKDTTTSCQLLIDLEPLDKDSCAA